MKRRTAICNVILSILIVTGFSTPGVPQNESSDTSDSGQPLLLVVNKSGHYLSFIDPEKMNELGRANTNAHSIMKIELQRMEVIDVLKKGNTPDGLAYIPR